VRIVNRARVQARVQPPAPAVGILVNGQTVPAVAGSSLSAALWNAGWRAFSAHPVNGRPRGPLCGMGVCQECLVWLDEADDSTDPDGAGKSLSPGRARLVRSCLEPVRAGLRVRLDPPAAGGETSA
jgi:hypothetical protein